MKKYLFLMILFWAVSVSAQNTPAPTPPPSKAEDTLAAFKNPEFPGGHRAFVQEILKNFRTSIPARQNIKTAKVIATFMVEADGSMSQIAIESSENEMVKNEFLRALKKVTKRWEPAEKEGVKVRTRMRQPLVFVLE